MAVQHRKLFHRIVQSVQGIASRISGNAHAKYSVEDQRIIRRLSDFPSCAYTDENPHRAPERFAAQFNSKLMLGWLYKNHDHPLFEQRNTTALHTLVRLQDTYGIKLMAQKQLDMNVTESASGLSCLNLLTGMQSHHRCRVFYNAQQSRMQTKTRDLLFTTLCQNGAMVDLSTLIHMICESSVQKRRQLACWYYFKHHHADALHALCHSNTTYAQWRSFCTLHLRTAFQAILDQPKRSTLTEYCPDQLHVIYASVVDACTNLLHSMDHTSSLSTDCVAS